MLLNKETKPNLTIYMYMQEKNVCYASAHLNENIFIGILFMYIFTEMDVFSIHLEVFFLKKQWSISLLDRWYIIYLFIYLFIYLSM